MLALLLAITVGQVDGVRVVGHAAEPALVRGDGLGIAWSSAPPVGARDRLEVSGDARVVARAGDDPLVVVGPRGVVIAADPEANPALVRWGYWKWLLHAADEIAAGREPGRFEDWVGAPVPHKSVRRFAAVAALLFLLGALAFWLARRRARQEPDAHRRFFAALHDPAEKAWVRPGMVRPLGGFLLFLSATVILLGPYLYLTAVAWPRWIQPFPEVDGSWGPVDEVMVLSWILVDFGIGTAFVQRFSQKRLSDPAGALRAGQLYVWWQIAGGLLLFAVGGAVACGILPHTRYALLSRVLLMRVVLQVPGILSLFGSIFQAAQRFDQQLGLDLLQNRVLLVLVPMGTILAGRALGRAHPKWGETFGALAGLAAGQYLALAMTCAIGWLLFRRLKLPIGPLFHAAFDRATFRDLTRFGAGIVAGKAPYFIANALEIALLTSLLPGYPAWLGIRQLLNGRLIFVLWFVFPFLDSGMPALAEALGLGKTQLARYYVVRYLQWGHWFAAIVIAFLVGAGVPLARQALSAEWQPVATYLPIAAAIGLFLPSAWLADSFQNGAGRSGLNALLLLIEQSLRVGLIWLLVPRLGFAGIFVALGLTLMVKSGLGWWVNHRLILRLELQLWAMVGAPLAAGAIWYGILVGASRILPPQIVFVAGALATFPLGLFLLGAARGLDERALHEVERAAELTSVMRPLARLLARAARAGSRWTPPTVSPLAEAAEGEIEELVASVAKLHDNQ